MIFVTVGSSQFPFDRLLRAVDAIEGDEELVVQHGPSTVRPRRARCVPFLSFAEISSYTHEARAVVCHGGIGSVLVALAEGKRPLAVPRRARFGETVDDHQVESVRALGRAGLVTPVDDPAGLAEALAAVSGEAWTPPGADGRLADELRDFIHASVGHAPAGAAS